MTARALVSSLIEDEDDEPLDKSFVIDPFIDQWLYYAESSSYCYFTNIGENWAHNRVYKGVCVRLYEEEEEGNTERSLRYTAMYEGDVRKLRPSEAPPLTKSEWITFETMLKALNASR